MLLQPDAPKPLPGPRSIDLLATELRTMVRTDELDLPMPGQGHTARRWAALAEVGRRDLALARLAEGHVDSLAILDEAGRRPVPDALYGVWAARSGGTGANLVEDGRRLTGTVRFCSGANVLDRALVAALGDSPQGTVGWLVEVDLGDPGVHRVPGTWAAIGMNDSDSIDVHLDVPITPDMVVGEPGWYLNRRGFALGSGGVAAVWLGGTAAVLDAVTGQFLAAPTVDEHQYAHFGALHAALRSAEALLAHSGEQVDVRPELPPQPLIATAKAAVEHAAWDTLDRVPRITGPTPLCRDRHFAQQLADLQVYVRQHHAERDLAKLGRMVLDLARDR